MSQARTQQAAKHGSLFFSRAGRALTAAALALLFTFSPLLPAAVPQAQAQFWHREKKAPPQTRQNSGRDSYQRGQRGAPQNAPRRSFWDKLFGRNKPPPEPRRPAPPAAPRQTAAAPEAVAKNPDARRILVLGDFTAAALSDGLTRAYSDNADIVIRAKAESASGLSRADKYDWPAALPAVTAQEKPQLIIIMLGANDRQALKTAEFGTEDWTKTYKARVQSLTRALQKSGAAWVWVGLPPFKQDSLNDAAAALNRLYKQAAEQAGGHFVDIWEGFVDDKGNFALSGYDVSGQTARLRANDGINFTLAGRRKLAFYAEQAIALLWGDSLSPHDMLDSANAGKAYDARLAPVNPLDIGLSGKPVLAGDAPLQPRGQARDGGNSGSAEADKTVSYRGRADDFSLPPAP